MPTLSVCMIVKNESLFLDNCLKSAKEGKVDEIIVVDTGSTDNTKEIAKKYTDKVFDYKWINDFAHAYNFSMSKAAKEWIIILDADEVISPKDIEKLKETLSKTDADSIMLVTRNYTNDSTRKNWKAIDDNPRYPESKDYKGYTRVPQNRVFRNGKGIIYEGTVHVLPDYSIKRLGLKIEKTEIPIHHYYEEKSKNSLKERQLGYLDLFEEKIKEEPTGELYYRAAGVYLYFKKDYKKSIDYFEKAIALRHKENECSEGIAQAYIFMKQYNDAYKIYSTLLKKRYITSTMANNLGNIFFLAKKHKLALKYLTIALKLGNPNKERINKNIETIQTILKKNSSQS